jgi:hypothetical protein
VGFAKMPGIFFEGKITVENKKEPMAGRQWLL